MPRSSRKSHKQHKYSSRDWRDYSDSEEEDALKERRAREGQGVSSGARVLKDSGSGEKRKAKDLVNSGNGEYSDDCGSSKRRKDRADLAVGSDRWDGGEDERPDGFDLKDTKSVSSVVDGKSKSSRRLESVTDRNEDSLVSSIENEEVRKGSGKLDSKRKSEKDGSRKELHKDVKEKERGSERDKKAQDGRRERSVDIVGPGSGGEKSRKPGAQMGDEERHYRKEGENTGDAELHDSDVEKDYEKQIKKRVDGSVSKEARADGDDDKRLPREDGSRNGKYKDEKHKDDRSKNRHHEDLQLEYRYNEDRPREERLSSDRTDRSDSRYSREENKTSESRHRKSKLPESNFEGSPLIDEGGSRYTDNHVRKNSSNDSEDYAIKDKGVDLEKNVPNTRKLDSTGDRKQSKSHSCHLDAVDSVTSNSRERNSSSSRVQVGKDTERYDSMEAESAFKDSLSDERRRRSSTSISGRVSESRYVGRLKQKADSHSDELSAENVTVSQYDRSPKSDRQSTPLRLVEKSPSSTSVDRRYSNRTSVRRSIDVEEIGPRSFGLKDHREYSANEDRCTDLLIHKPAGEDFSQADSYHRESTPASSAFNRMGAFANTSLGLPSPGLPFRQGIDSSSIMVSSEDDSRSLTGDRKLNIRSKRISDSMSKNQGNNAWMGVPNWPPPITNGFLPFQPPTAGFHPVVQQFPSLFGVRPGIELTHSGVPWHDPSRPFGWQNPPNDSLPTHLHGWDGNSGLFGEESHIYGRLDWDRNRQPVGNQGWDVNPDIRKGANGNANLEFPIGQKEADYSSKVSADETWSSLQSGQRMRCERNRPERLPAESIEIKRSGSKPIAKKSAETASNIFHDKIPELTGQSKLEDNTSFYRVYLSKLDISVDLTSPELYKQCMNLTGTVKDIALDLDIDADVSLEDNKAIVAEGSSDNLGALLFPASTKTAFQKSMELYKRQKEELKGKIPDSSARNADLNKPVLSAAESEAVKSCGDIDKGTVQTMTELPQDDAKGVILQTTEEDKQVDSLVNAKERGCDTISDGVVFSDGSEACEASRPELVECRVNLSRIPNAPQSTH